MDDTKGPRVTAAFAVLVLVLGSLGALATVTLERPVNELPGPGRDEVVEPWRVHVGAMDRALERADASAAVRAWRDAHSAALDSRRWEAMIEVGDAALRMGEAREGSKLGARQAYLTALGRARRDGSVDGVRRAAAGFDALGDLEVAARCRAIAARMAKMAL